MIVALNHGTWLESRSSNSEFGIRNSEFGIRNAECGMRNAECGVRLRSRYLVTLLRGSASQLLSSGSATFKAEPYFHAFHGGAMERERMCSTAEPWNEYAEGIVWPLPFSISPFSIWAFSQLALLSKTNRCFVPESPDPAVGSQEFSNLFFEDPRLLQGF